MKDRMRNGSLHSRLIIINAIVMVWMIVALMFLAVLKKFESQYFWVSLAGIIGAIVACASWAHSASERRKTLENVESVKRETK